MLDSPIQDIKDKLPIETVLADYIQLKKAGANFKAVCPFHSEKTPSFMVSTSKQIWHCFGCGLGGDIFEFVKQIENVDFPQALKMLADRAGVELKKPSQAELKIAEKKHDLYEINAAAAKYFERVLWESQAGAQALAYLRGRGLTDQTIRAWQLGYAPDDFHYLEKFLAKTFAPEDAVAAGVVVRKDDGSRYDRFRDRIMFPIRNIHGQVVGFTGRVLKDQPNVGKYINSPETPIYNKSRELYGLFEAKNQIRREARVVLMEGNMDVISSHQAGFGQAVASSGTALGSQQLTVLKRFCENIIFAFDSDTAGSAATKRAVEEALSLGFNVKIANLAPAKDPDELIKKGIGLWRKAMETAPNYIEYYFDKLFREGDVASVEGKRAIAKELAPLILRMSDPVTKAHFVRKLSGGINVAEHAIWDIINKLTSPKPPKAAGIQEKRKSRREILEDQLLGLVLILKDGTVLADFSEAEFGADNKKLFGVLAANGTIDPDALRKQYPDLAAKIDLLSFASQVDTGEQDLKPELELARIRGELKRLTVKEQMQQVAVQMAAAEKAADSARLSQLSAEFTRLSQEITNLDK